MRRLFALSLLCCWISLMRLSFAAGFIDGFEDVPMPDKFRQLTNQNFSFANEETSLTEAVLIAKKQQTFDSVKTFYTAVLPALGWNFIQDKNYTLTFFRDDSVLEISRLQTKPLKISVTLKNTN